MDPTGASSAGRFEIFDANERYVVVRDDEGYAVWRFDDLEDGEALERFDDTDEGYDAAAARWKHLTKEERRRRVPALPALKWFVIVAACLWLSSTVLASTLFLQVSGDPFGGEGAFQTLVRWSQLVAIAAEAGTIGGVAVYVVLWLDARR